jgi:hypothetical protein
MGESWEGRWALSTYVVTVGAKSMTRPWQKVLTFAELYFQSQMSLRALVFFLFDRSWIGEQHNVLKEQNVL